MTKHTRALKQAEQAYAKANNKLEKLQMQHENMQQSLHENEQDNTEDIQKELNAIIERNFSTISLTCSSTLLNGSILTRASVKACSILSGGCGK